MQTNSYEYKSSSCRSEPVMMKSISFYQRIENVMNQGVKSIIGACILHGFWNISYQLIILNVFWEPKEA